MKYALNINVVKEKTNFNKTFGVGKQWGQPWVIIKLFLKNERMSQIEFFCEKIEFILIIYSKKIKH